MGGARLPDRKVYLLVMEDGESLEITAGGWSVSSAVLTFTDEFGNEIFQVAPSAWRCVYPKEEEWRIQDVEEPDK